MTDYFTRLAERSLGITEGIQPLIAPRFAPLDDQTLTAHEPTTSALESTPPIAPRPRGDASPLDTTPVSRKRPTAEPAHVGPQTREPIARVETTPAFAETAPVASLLLPDGPRRPLDESIPAPHSLPSSAELPPVPIPAAPAAPELAKTPPVSSAIHSLAESVTDRPATPVADRGEEHAIPEREPPSPIVRVTIGRIEVRAVSPVPPPTRTPPAKPPGPRLTLESYLRARSEGES